MTSEVTPLAGKVNWKPLNVIVWLVTRPDTPEGTLPVVVLKVRLASMEKPVELMRLVIATGRVMLRLPVTAAPGVPVQRRSISPMRSAKPSMWTMVGTAETAQVVGVWADRPKDKVAKSTMAIHR